MKKFSVLVFVVCLILAGCSSAPDYSSKEAFIKDFILALDSNQRARFAAFYVQEGDFEDSPEAEALKSIALGSTRMKFIENAQKLALEMEGKQVSVKDIAFSKSVPILASILTDVKDSFSNVRVTLDVDGQTWLMDISEVINVGEEWRLTSFFTTVDLGTEQLDPVEIEVPIEDQEITEEKQ